MKKIISILMVTICTLLGCKNNVLDITPDGRITLDDVFKDEKQTEAFLNTVYGSIPTYAWSYQAWAFLAGITDEAMEPQAYKSVVVSGQWATGSLTPSYNPLSLTGNTGAGMNRYATYWAGIRNANIFLANIDQANVPNPVNKSRFKAEAQLLRAFYYWELIKQFGPMPIVDASFDQTFDYGTLKRPSFQENIDFIVKDCESAIPGLPMRISIEAQRGRFNKALAYAIKSEALLYNASPLWNPESKPEKWDAAAIAAKDALSALTGQKDYVLAADYGEYFLNKSDISNSPADKETIFERVMQATMPSLSNINSIPSNTGYTKVGSCPSQELVDSYEMQATGQPAILGYEDADHLKPIVNSASGYDANNPYNGRDPRFYATVWYNGATYNLRGNNISLMTHTTGADRLVMQPQGGSKFTSTGYYLRKFIDPRLPPEQKQNGDWKKYRLAEIYLNYAEALNEFSGPSFDVYEAINTIRRRAKMPELPMGLTKEQMRERIRRERRVELVWEEHRFWDVRRWKILSDTDKLVTGMEITKKQDNTYTYRRFVSERRNSWQDKYLIFPIPIEDVSIVPDFQINQNPGW